MLNELKNKVVRGEDITVEEARRLAENPLKEELYDAAHELTVKLASRAFDMCHHQCEVGALPGEL